MVNYARRHRKKSIAASRAAPSPRPGTSPMSTRGMRPADLAASTDENLGRICIGWPPRRPLRLAVPRIGPGRPNRKSPSGTAPESNRKHGPRPPMRPMPVDRPTSFMSPDRFMHESARALTFGMCIMHSTAGGWTG